MDLYETRGIKPMLIGSEQPAFDDPDFIFELKLDGERCLAYLDPKGGTELRNKRDLRMLPKVPELSELHKQVRKRCILDGELAVIRNGRPDFSAIQRRSLMTNPFRIKLAAREAPACFTAFDLLYEGERPVMDRPLLERKELLSRAVKEETPRLAVSRYIPERGEAFFALTQRQGLEGVVGKRSGSLYFQGKRTKDWVKCKNLKDEDFIVCGYLHKENNRTSLVLGQLSEGRLAYQGHVTLGVGGGPFREIKALPVLPSSPFPELPPGNEGAVWVAPYLVCTVSYMERTSGGGMRQPVFKGLREDKKPEECRAAPTRLPGIKNTGTAPL